MPKEQMKSIISDRHCDSSKRKSIGIVACSQLDRSKWGRVTHHANGVPCRGDDDVSAGDDAGAYSLERRLDVVDEVVAEDATVLRRRLLRIGPVQQDRRVAPLQ
jgi:hypothetical protein